MSQTTARTSAIPPPTRFTVELCKFIEDYCKAHADTSVVTVLGGLETIRYY